MTAPVVVVFIALPVSDVALQPGVTPLFFEGAARLTPQAFGLSLDDSVIGVGIQDAPERDWRYVAVGDPEERRLLRWGERVLAVREMDAELVGVELPSALEPR